MTAEHQPAPRTEAGRVFAESLRTGKGARKPITEWIIAIEQEATDKAMLDAFDDVLAIDRQEAARPLPESQPDWNKLRRDGMVIPFDETDDRALPDRPEPSLNVSVLEQALFGVRFNPLKDSSRQWAEKIAAEYQRLSR